MTDKTVADDNAAAIALFARQQHNWMERVLKGSADPVEIACAVHTVIDKPRYLHKLTSIPLTIHACSGTRTIAKAKSVFPGYIDGDFVSWGLDKPSSATQETLVEVHEQTKDGMSTQIFGSVGADLDKLCLTQDQIIDFVETHPNQLHPNGYSTFFLFKEGDKFFIVGVGVRDGGLEVRVDLLGDGGVWRAGYRRRFVIPKLTA